MTSGKSCLEPVALAAAVAFAAVTGAATVAYGQGKAEAGPSVIGVLPLSAQDSSTAIYSKPVADELARHLRKRLADTGDLTIEPLASSSSVPARVALLVDGRIVTASGKRVILEAHIRDPESGARFSNVATAPRSLTAIDRLAVELGDKLGPALVKALEARRRRRASVPAPPPTASEADARLGNAATGDGARTSGNESASGEGGASGDVRTASGRRVVRGDGTTIQSELWRLVVFDAVGSAAEGNVPVAGVATEAGYAMARRLGFRPVASREQGIVEPRVAVTQMQQARAYYGLMMDVLDIEFHWQGVLIARGQVRVILIDRNGAAIYDRIHRTDSLVGSRGDRHAALVGFVLGQVGDIFVPELARAIARAERIAATGSATAEPAAQGGR